MVDGIRMLPMINAQQLAMQLGPQWRAIGMNAIERKPRIVHTCSCLIQRTLAEYRALPYVGIMDPEDGIEPTQLEQRNCTCGSTIGIWLTSDGQYYDDSDDA